MSPDEEARVLWAEHQATAFPARLRGEEVAGVDMVMLDADIAGCVVTWLGASGGLDASRRDSLERCLDDIDRVLPLIQDTGEREYYERLRRLARLALT